MRVLVALDGRNPGAARRALPLVPFDQLHLFSADPSGAEATSIEGLVGAMGGTFTVEGVAPEDLLGSFEAVSKALHQYRSAGDEVACAMHAGSDENLLSAAALLACLHEGVDVHILDERGEHTVLPVLTAAPLRELLKAEEQAALRAFPPQGIPIDRIAQHDPGALAGLKRRQLLVKEGTRLVLTGHGRAYQEHLA